MQFNFRLPEEKGYKQVAADFLDSPEYPNNGDKSFVDHMYEADDLLDMVDEWKFKLRDKLEKMTPEQRTAFWQETHERARAAGLPVADEVAKRRRRATG